MSNIYDALMQAQHEKEMEEIPLDVPREAAGPSDLPGPYVPSRSIQAEVLGLYRSVDAALQDRVPRILQFIGVRGGEGVSTIVYEFARTAVSTGKRRVLILDAAHHNPSQHRYLKDPSDYGWLDALRESQPITKACYRFEESNLFLSPITIQSSLSPSIRDKAAAAAFFSELRNSFELVLIDSSPAAVSPDSVALSALCDGVIMVLEAEKTNWRVAETVRDRIAQSGGKIVGAVFNKRKYYIPEMVYRFMR